LLTKG